MKPFAPTLTEAPAPDVQRQLDILAKLSGNRWTLKGKRIIGGIEWWMNDRRLLRGEPLAVLDVDVQELLLKQCIYDVTDGVNHEAFEKGSPAVLSAGLGEGGKS